MADSSAAAEPRSDETDEELLAEIAAGNRRAFKQLADRHTARLLRLAWRYAGQAANAEDIVQEALVRIWQRAGQWDGVRGAGKSWIDRIVINLCFDQGRRLVPAVGVEALDGHPDQQIDPHTEFSGKQLQQAIIDAIHTLPDRQRAALSLCFGRETDCAEGARILGLSISAMESLLQRGRRSVRRQLTTLGFIEER